MKMTSKSSFQIYHSRIKKALNQFDDLDNDEVDIVTLENWLIEFNDCIEYSSKSKAKNEIINYFRVVTQEVKHVCKIKELSSKIKADIKNESLANQKLYIDISNSFKLVWDINNHYVICMNSSPQFGINISKYSSEIEFILSIKNQTVGLITK